MCQATAFAAVLYCHDTLEPRIHLVLLYSFMRINCIQKIVISLQEQLLLTWVNVFIHAQSDTAAVMTLWNTLPRMLIDTFRHANCARHNRHCLREFLQPFEINTWKAPVTISQILRCEGSLTFQVGSLPLADPLSHLCRWLTGKFLKHSRN